MKKIIVLFLFIIFCGFNINRSDEEIKRIAFENTLSKRQIYFVLHTPIRNSIVEYKSRFKCSERDLKIATVAVICLETGNLKSKSVYVNNLFGIKNSVDKRPKFTMMTTEYINGKKILIDQNFTSFYSFTDCINGFYKFLSKDRYIKVRQAKNYKEFLYEMKKGGYATDPNYFNKVYKIALEIDKTTK